MAYETYKGPPIEPEQFASDEFCEVNFEFVNAYVDLRVKGCLAPTALGKVFGYPNVSDKLTYARVTALESTSYYVDRFEKRLNEMPLDEMLTTRMALNFFLEIAGDTCGNAGLNRARTAAMKEACVLRGLVFTDDEGNTQKRPGLEDFYRANGVDPHALPVDQIDAKIAAEDAARMAASPTKH